MSAPFDRVAELLVELRALSPEERAARVRAIEDPALRTEVESLLAHGDKTAFLETRPLHTRTRSTGPSTAALTAASGDRERFLPGTVLDGRYRIISLLGRGGMGEVYRADDLKLGESVALKFLPPGLERDEGRLERLIKEVRTARLVTHINVCRVFDVGEVNGQHYLSMEYVDGEDLASLLKRIGRLPQDKAIQVARQIAAGLHAAHAQGILHRDLKPANVMIDGRGQVKITDFGLADLESAIKGTDIRSGTPAYMAPEQLAGDEVTVRSDLYALGLVLYELFTGTAAFDAPTLGELIELHRAVTPASPSSHVEGLDRTVERAILRCLEKDPRDRPASALEIAAALPGGDQLMGALMAGETPSPEVVAAAGARGLLPKPIAVTLLIVALASIVVSVLLADRVWLTARVVPPKTPTRLSEDAVEMIQRLRDRGILEEAGPNPYDAAYGIWPDYTYLQRREDDPELRQRHALDADRPAAVRFWYRQSPWALHAAPDGLTLNSVGPFNPEPSRHGMVNITLDLRGRLLRLTAIPRTYATTGERTTESVGPDWSVMFDEAGLDPGAFEQVTPRWTPPTYCDRREAWIGTPIPDLEVRVEACSLQDRVVGFVVLMPWQVPGDGAVAGDAPALTIATMIGLPVSILFGVGGVLLAWKNVRRRRGDRRGAWRIWAFTFIGGLTYWLLTISRFPNGATGFIGSLQQAIAIVMFWSTTCGILYFALEPYVRRRWPERMIAWSRAIAGRWRDPLVGRDILIGTALGLGATTLTTAVDVLGRSALGLSEALPVIGPVDSVSLRGSIGAVCMSAVLSPANSFIGLILVLLLKVVVRKLWLSIAILGVIMLLLFASSDPDYPLWSLVQFAIVTGTFFFALFRCGLLTGIAWTFAFIVLTSLPAASDPFAWYGSQALVGFIALAALAVYGFTVSMAGRPLVSDSVLEE